MYFDTLRPIQNGHHSADGIFELIFLEENCYILKGPISNTSSLVQIMDWHMSGTKSLSAPKDIPDLCCHMMSLGHNELKKNCPMFDLWFLSIRHQAKGNIFHLNCRAVSRLALSQWEMLLQSYAVSHWLVAHLESALQLTNAWRMRQPNCIIKVTINSSKTYHNMWHHRSGSTLDSDGTRPLADPVWT